MCNSGTHPHCHALKASRSRKCPRKRIDEASDMLILNQRGRRHSACVLFQRSGTTARWRLAVGVRKDRTRRGRPHFVWSPSSCLSRLSVTAFAPARVLTRHQVLSNPTRRRQGCRDWRWGKMSPNSTNGEGQNIEVNQSHPDQSVSGGLHVCQV